MPESRWHTLAPARWGALIVLAFLSCGRPPASLEERVGGFWDALVKRDRVGAQEFVVPQSRNDFLRRPERLYRSWSLLGIERPSEEEAKAQIAYEGFFEDVRQFHPLKEWQLWKKVDGEWFLHVDPKEKVIEEALRGPLGGGRRRRAADGKVRVSKQIRIPFFNRAQMGTLAIRNGTGEAIRIVGVSLDETLFRVVEKPDEIPAGQEHRVKIVHLGPDELKNQKASLALEIEQEGSARPYEVEILYNYISPGLRGILGLTEEKAAGLKRTDKVTPNLAVELSPEQADEAQKMRQRVERSRQP